MRPTSCAWPALNIDAVAAASCQDIGARDEDRDFGKSVSESAYSQPLSYFNIFNSQSSLLGFYGKVTLHAAGLLAFIISDIFRPLATYKIDSFSKKK